MKDEMNSRRLEPQFNWTFLSITAGMWLLMLVTLAIFTLIFAACGDTITIQGLPKVDPPTVIVNVPEEEKPITERMKQACFNYIKELSFDFTSFNKLKNGLGNNVIMNENEVYPHGCYFSSTVNVRFEGVDLPCFSISANTQNDTNYGNSKCDGAIDDHYLYFDFLGW